MNQAMTDDGAAWTFGGTHRWGFLTRAWCIFECDDGEDIVTKTFLRRSRAEKWLDRQMEMKR